MQTPLYIFSNGRLSRRDNSVLISYKDKETQNTTDKFIPIENLQYIYCFGQMDCNSALLNFLGKKGISLHFFDFYEHYSGSFIPKKEMLNGKTLVEQALIYHNENQRLILAKSFIKGAVKNMIKNLNYYKNRGKNTQGHLLKLKEYSIKIDNVRSIKELMGVEGNIRMVYYDSFNHIINDFSFEKRVKNPPKGEINCLISFLNMMCYAICTDAIHQTGLNSTISFLHEPAERRHSLALDIAEIFKPILVDRVIFTLFNKRIIQEKDFEIEPDRIWIKEDAKKKIVKLWDEKLNETIFYKPSKQYLSYKNIILKECHKLQKHILKEKTYQPFETQW